MFKPNIIAFLVMFLLVITFDISEAKGGRGGGGGRGGSRGSSRGGYRSRGSSGGYYSGGGGKVWIFLRSNFLRNEILLSWTFPVIKIRFSSNQNIGED